MVGLKEIFNVIAPLILFLSPVLLITPGELLSVWIIEYFAEYVLV